MVTQQRSMHLCRRAKALLLPAAFVALISTPMLSSCAGAMPSPKQAESEHQLVGTKAPDFDLPLVDSSGRVKLSDFAGKVVVVDFWATWCEPCKNSFPAYQRLSEKHAEHLVVVGVSVDDTPEGIENFARETGARFPLVWDEAQRVAQSFKPPAMPTSFIIDPQGIVRFVHAGYESGDDRAIEARVEELLAGSSG